MFSDNAYVTILLCSHLLKDDGAKPFSIVEWSNLAANIINSKIKEPAGLMQLSKQEIQNNLLISEENAERISILLSRGAKLAFALEELSRKGIGVVTKSDKEYPKRIKALLKKNAPPLLYYSGDISLINSKGIAIVGSRNIDEKGVKFAYDLAKKAAGENLTIFSGGAKGIDTTSEQSAIENRGKVVSILADSLSQRIKKKEIRERIVNKQLLLISANNPDAPFSAGGAMNRNKYIYCLSSAAFVIASDFNKGGTWAGAIENIKNNWVKTFIWDNKTYDGNKKLIEKGGIPLTDIAKDNLSDLISEKISLNNQMDLFGIYEKDLAIRECSEAYIKEVLEEITDTVKDKNTDTSAICKKDTELVIDEFYDINSKKNASRISGIDKEKILETQTSYDLFDIVIPSIIKLLKQPMTLEEIALKLNINKKQASTWIERAMSLSMVSKLNKPVRYISK
ncbi:DNA-protecting protein DprA [Ruminiclostridium herbifermentans]|uniref:DNA-protecting protein DprA n=1 Tax=Ruminiclostridium herbifermentans TaxID=2488810 RepID=A0A4U7JJW9_9FIRM|nr:DNA-processing protein DprA [Ruminiclostridium herbifermentans]QNU65458.1 DNA-protecting protein DprA [Ruminiclostridium herbifermentans]